MSKDNSDKCDMTKGWNDLYCPYCIYSHFPVGCTFAEKGKQEYEKFRKEVKTELKEKAPELVELLESGEIR